jgi:hypothetical protein
MSTGYRPAHIDWETRNAFNELLAMDRLSALPVASLLRVLKTLPQPLLEAALAKRENV